MGWGASGTRVRGKGCSGLRLERTSGWHYIHTIHIAVAVAAVVAAAVVVAVVAAAAVVAAGAVVVSAALSAVSAPLAA